MNQVQVSQTESKTSRIAIAGVHEYLTEEGYRPNLDEDGDIRFKAEGRTYYIRFDEKDPTFVRICAINVASSLELSREQALEYVNKVSSDIKVSKAFMLERGDRPVIWVTAECRYASTQEFASQLEQLLSGVRAAVDHLYEIHESRPKEAEKESEEELATVH